MQSWPVGYELVVRLATFLSILIVILALEVAASRQKYSDNAG